MGEVFAVFYERLYKEDVGMQCGTSDELPDQGAAHIPITTDELRSSLKRLRNKKTGADDGLVAEMLKTEHCGLLAAMVDLFNEI